MPRPKCKEELLHQAEENHHKLIDYIHTLSTDQLNAEFPKGTLNRNVKDVMAHLHEWHVLMLSWYEAGMKGEKPVMPAPGYTWKTLPAFNRLLWEQNKDMELEEAISRFNKSYGKIRHIIQQHSDDELFEKKRYKWTGSTSLGAYLISNTSSHYDWGLKLIRKCMKKMN